MWLPSPGKESAQTHDVSCAPPTIRSSSLAPGCSSVTSSWSSVSSRPETMASRPSFSCCSRPGCLVVWLCVVLPSAAQQCWQAWRCKHQRVCSQLCRCDEIYCSFVFRQAWRCKHCNTNGPGFSDVAKLFKASAKPFVIVNGTTTVAVTFSN